MNKIKTFGVFLCGMITGAGIAVLCVKKHYQNETDRQIQEMEDYYNRSDSYRRVKRDRNEEETEEGSEKGRENGIQDNDVRKAAKDAIKNRDGKYTDYTKCYSGNVTEKAETELDKETEEEVNRDAEMLKECEDYEQDMAEERLPERIEETALGDLPSRVGHQILLYYAYDETITDEDCNLIEDYERLVGEVLVDEGFMDDDTDLIFVWNHELEVCYEVQKIFAAYGEREI